MKFKWKVDGKLKDRERELQRSLTGPEREQILGELLSPKKRRIYFKINDAYHVFRILEEQEDRIQLSDDIVDRQAVNPYSAVENESLLEAVREKFSVVLDPREQTVLRLRLGLDGSEGMSLKEIGARLRYTRERVRQIERDALGKLQKSIDPEATEDVSSIAGKAKFSHKSSI